MSSTTMAAHSDLMVWVHIKIQAQTLTTTSQSVCPDMELEDTAMGLEQPSTD